MRKKSGMNVLLDSNFLLIPGKFKVDIFSELTKFGKPKLYTLDLVIKEIEKLSKGKGKSGSYARLALKLVKLMRIRILRASGKNTDDEIVKKAGNGFVVCTQDIELIKRLKRQGTIVLSLRQKKFLEKR